MALGRSYLKEALPAYGQAASNPMVRLCGFTMLTINADDHPLMRNYHKPNDEKRMIVILQDDEYDAWLSATPEETSYFLRHFPAEALHVKHDIY